MIWVIANSKLCVVFYNLTNILIVICFLLLGVLSQEPRLSPSTLSVASLLVLPEATALHLVSWESKWSVMERNVEEKQQQQNRT